MFYETIAKTTVHPFYFPTQVIYIDDDINFIKSMVLIMPVEFSYYWFSNPMVSLNYFQDFKHEALVSKSLTLSFADSFKKPPLDFCLNEEMVFKYLKTPSRFDEISNAVIDYLMPDMDGISLCKYVSDKIHKTILTGASDKDKTLFAFNAKAIDNYFLKEDAAAIQLIAKTIEESEHEYFSSLTMSVYDYLGLNHFLNNRSFKQYFYGMLINRQVVEYYLIQPNKFLSLDSSGQCFLTLIETPEALFKHYEVAKSRGAPKELLDQLNAGGFVPYFPTKDGFYDSTIEYWENHLHKQSIVEETGDIYVCSTLPITSYKDYDLGSIYTLDKYKDKFPDGDVD